MGAAVRKPAKSATKSAISRLQGELHPELWEGHRPAPGGPAMAEAPQDRAPGHASAARGGHARAWSAAAGGARGDSDDSDGDGAGWGELPGELAAGLDYESLAAGYASSSDEEVDVGSDAKVARVRKLMELPVAEAGAGRRLPDRQIRAMLADAHRRCQGIDMLDFVHECKRRLEEEDDLERSSAGRRCSHHWRN
jgi:hypothetical protein